MEDYEKINLDISEKIKTLLTKRGIQKEDLQQAIHHAETTGEKFVSTDTDHSLASYRPDRVTFWVEYSKVYETYKIHTAYSHRTEMKRKGTP